MLERGQTRAGARVQGIGTHHAARVFATFLELDESAHHLLYRRTVPRPPSHAHPAQTHQAIVTLLRQSHRKCLALLPQADAYSVRRCRASMALARPVRSRLCGAGLRVDLGIDRLCVAGASAAAAPSAPGPDLPLLHLRRDRARPSHICTRTGLTPATSALRPGQVRKIWRCRAHRRSDGQSVTAARGGTAHPLG
jgi:hypothetical protein